MEKKNEQQPGKDYVLVLTTVPNEAKGHEIARALVEKRLAACVTTTSSAKSFYWWEEKIVEDTEFVLLIKTRRGLFPLIQEEMKTIHPYEVPELIALPIQEGSKAYLEWVEAETRVDE